MTTRSYYVGLGAAALLLVGCTDYEPGIKAIEALGPVMAESMKDCGTAAKKFGEEANTFGKVLLDLPDKHNGKLKSEGPKLKEKYSARLEAPCKTIIAGADKCRLDGAMNISGHGQKVITLCKIISE